MFKKKKTIMTFSDAELVMDSLGGDRNAFCEIVRRYQTLLCSVAYSSVGDFKQSEDIAQETFIEAWKKLGTLKDPVKLKAWLCGILRFKVSHFLRKEGKHKECQTEELNEEQLTHVNTENMDEHAIQKQKEAMLWQVLNTMDNTYREPLILFYREQQSVDESC